MLEKFDDETVRNIAMVCHETNRAFCRSIGDDSQAPWNVAPDWQQSSAMAGVRSHLNQELTPEQSHELWMQQKVQDGWVFGDVKDAEKKTHPCIRPYHELPLEQQMKDHLFGAVVRAFKTVIEAKP